MECGLTGFSFSLPIGTKLKGFFVFYVLLSLVFHHSFRGVPRAL